MPDLQRDHGQVTVLEPEALRPHRWILSGTPNLAAGVVRLGAHGLLLFVRFPADAASLSFVAAEAPCFVAALLSLLSCFPLFRVHLVSTEASLSRSAPSN